MIYKSTFRSNKIKVYKCYQYIRSEWSNGRRSKHCVFSFPLDGGNRINRVSMCHNKSINKLQTRLLGISISKEFAVSKVIFTSFTCNATIWSNTEASRYAYNKSQGIEGRSWKVQKQPKTFFQTCRPNEPNCVPAIDLKLVITALVIFICGSIFSILIMIIERIDHKNQPSCCSNFKNNIPSQYSMKNHSILVFCSIVLLFLVIVVLVLLGQHTIG